MAPLPSPTAPLKCVVGIDIAKDSFVACVGHSTLGQHLHFGQETTFAHTASGFAALLSWVANQHASDGPLWFVVEATGVYYEELAYFLADNNQLLRVLLPNKVKHFARSTDLTRKTDQLDARLLGRLGLERALPAWRPPTPALRQLRALARERQALVRPAAQLKIRARAHQHRYQPASRTVARLAAQQQLLASQLKALDHALADLLPAEPELARKPGQRTSIPGTGLTTAIVVVAETSGFVLVENARQRASYAGLDVVQRQSGHSAHATRTSRRGNVRLRTARYLPAVSNLRCNPQQIAFDARLRARQPSGKPGVIAVMRKLLVLCCSLWKNDCPYDPPYRPAHVAEKEVASTT